MDKAVDINCYMLVKMKNRYVNLSNLSFRNSFLFFYFLSQVKVETDIKLKLIIHMAFKSFECQPFFSCRLTTKKVYTSPRLSSLINPGGIYLFEDKINFLEFGSPNSSYCKCTWLPTDYSGFLSNDYNRDNTFSIPIFCPRHLNNGRMYLSVVVKMQFFHELEVARLSVSRTYIYAFDSSCL